MELLTLCYTKKHMYSPFTPTSFKQIYSLHAIRFPLATLSNAQHAAATLPLVGIQKCRQ
jgi:hypothetical protein